MNNTIKTLTTITGAFNHIKRNLNTGIEKTLNDSIHFGVGDRIYTWSSDVNEMNLPDLKASGNPFTYLETDEHLTRAISYLLQKDGHLIIR